MSEFRQNILNRTWVLMAPNRSKRPEDFRTYSVMAHSKEHDPTCVFCPGKEALNKELDRHPQSKDWTVRLIENKFHALEHTTAYKKKDFYVSRAGLGSHEVLITRKHNEPVSLQSVVTIENSLRLLSDRTAKLYQDPQTAYVQVFHNHGRDAGASLVHPHYQLLALPLVPGHVQEEISGSFHYHQNNGRCFYCDMIGEERSLGQRFVYETDRFAVICAYASRKPFETWILPKQHLSRFEQAGPQTLAELSFVLKWVLERLYVKLSDPPLNCYIHSLPSVMVKQTMHRDESYHWHLTVFPRLTIWGGFEYAVGIPINPVLPEDSAVFLRG